MFPNIRVPRPNRIGILMQTIAHSPCSRRKDNILIKHGHYKSHYARCISIGVYLHVIFANMIQRPRMKISNRVVM